MKSEEIKILIASHKPFKIPEGKVFVPIHAGRDVAQESSKDGVIKSSDYQWMLENTIGDNSGDNISAKNRLFSECTVLYWAWKNYIKLGTPKYIGLMHYRRHFVFRDDYYKNSKQTKLESALSYITEPFIDEKYISNIGLSDDEITKASHEFDLVVSKESNLKLINNGRNVREDYIHTIAGTKAKDFDLMMNIVKELSPEYFDVLTECANSPHKFLYQMFIMKRELFFEYCDFLFPILFELENRIDFTDYSQNGKRSVGYLAEILLTVFVRKKQREENLRILRLGCTLVEYPYEKSYLRRQLEKGSPRIFDFIRYKAISFFLKGTKKQINKEKYQGIRNSIKAYSRLKNLLLTKDS